MKKEDLFGKRMTIVGIVEEHLTLESKAQEWVKLRFPNGSTIVIDIKHCKEVRDENNNEGNPRKDH